MRPRKWTKLQLKKAAEKSKSIRQVIVFLGLKPAGGNYSQIKKYLDFYNIDTAHFTGKAWNKGMTGIGIYRTKLEDVLVRGGHYQSYKLKKRLFAKGIKKLECEICKWAKYSVDGRLPLELDHINGDNSDNTLENLRVLCPNCHSLQLTHRGRNRKKKQ